MTARRLLAALLALVSATGVWVAWRLLVGTYTGQLMEDAALSGSLIGARYVSEHARALLHVVSMPLLIGLVLLILVLGLRWSGPRRTLGAAGVVIATNASTQVLKHWVLDRPEYGLSQRWDGANTLPSGHTAVAASAAVALVLLVAPRWRPAAAWAGAVLTAAMGYSTLVCQWHRPADVWAAILLALTWGLVAVVLGAWVDDAGEPGGEGALTGAAVLGGVGAVALALALALELWTWRAVVGAAAAGAALGRVDSFLAYAAGSLGTAGLSAVAMALLTALTERRSRRA